MPWAVAFVCGYELRLGGALARRLPQPRHIEKRAAVVWSIVLTVLAASAFLVLVTRFSGLSGFRVLLSGRSNAVDQLSAESSYVWLGSRLDARGSIGRGRRSDGLCCARALSHGRPIGTS